VALAGLVMLAAGLWGSLAICVRLAPPSPLREVLSGGRMLLALAAIVCLSLRRWWMVMLYRACFAALLAWGATLMRAIFQIGTQPEYRGDARQARSAAQPRQGPAWHPPAARCLKQGPICRKQHRCTQDTERSWASSVAVK
jgi:hypothetical protein